MAYLRPATQKGELLGFDRMAELVHQPAAVIAQAAQNWGQEDDIIVLSVMRAAKSDPFTA